MSVDNRALQGPRAFPGGSGTRSGRTPSTVGSLASALVDQTRIAATKAAATALAAAAAIAALTALAGNAEAASPHPFSVGEKISYSVYAVGVKIAKQTIEIHSRKQVDGVDVYSVKGLSKTSSLLGIVYRLDDKWDVWMEGETLYPVRVEKDWAEGKGEGLYVYEIDQQNRVVLHRDIVSGKLRTYKPKNVVFDLFSLIYFYRANASSMSFPFTFDFLETKAVRTVQFADEGVVELIVNRISPNYPVKCRKLKQIGGVGIEIYVSEDSLRLPIKLLTPAKLSKKQVIDIEFVIDGYEPGADQEPIPREYRRLKP